MEALSFPALPASLSAGLASQCWTRGGKAPFQLQLAVSLWVGSAGPPVGKEEVISTAHTCAYWLPAGLLAGTCADINTA